MTPISERQQPKPADELVFLPLGGSNEIGMNFNLYGYGPPHARKWIVVDLGVTFGDQTTPGVEIILPDPTFIEEHSQGHPRHRPDPRPRGPYRRRRLVVAAAEGAALRHALHRLPAAREAARAGAARRGQDHRNPAQGHADPRPLRNGAADPDPLDPRAQRRRDPHPARHHPAHRRLEDRPRSPDRRGDR